MINRAEVVFVNPTILNALSGVSDEFLLAFLLQKGERVSIEENLNIAGQEQGSQ